MALRVEDSVKSECQSVMDCCDKKLYPRLRINPSPFRLGCLYCSVVRREVIPLIAEQSAILSIQNVSTQMCISGNGFVQSSEDNEA